MPAYELDMQELPLFHELTSAEIERFLLSTEAQVKRYGKGAHILEAYQSNAQIGVMVEGVAQVVAEDRFGNETVGHTLHRGDMMGSIRPSCLRCAAIRRWKRCRMFWCCG